MGVGPGDPELMTLKSVKVLDRTPVVAVPKSASSAGDSVALTIAREVVDLKGKEILELPFPMTKDRDALLASRVRAAEAIVSRLARGLDVAFITLGDPLLYSTFSYLIPLVRDRVEGVRVRTVSGVTSMCAAASLASAPLAEADEKVVIIPAAYDLDEVRYAIEHCDTVVLMKVNRKFDALVEMLGELGVEESSIFTSRVGWPEDEFMSTDITSLKGRKLDYFSMIIVRKGIQR